MTKLVLQMNNAGFFANFNAVINHLRYSVETGKVSAFEVDWRKSSGGNPRYHTAEESDLWSRFFEPIVIDGPFDSVRHTRGFANGNMTHVNAYFHLYMQGDSWRRAYNHIYRKYVHLRPDVAGAVASYYSRYMEGRNCIGVHYRNKAHSIENPQPDPTVERFIEIAGEHMLPDSENVIYLATDVESAIDPFRAAFGNSLLFRDSVMRSEDHGRQIHNDSRVPPRRLAQDVLLDALLLSKTNKFIHTTSNVATAVGFINPRSELIYARYDDKDPRGMEPVLYQDPQLLVREVGKDEYELRLQNFVRSRLVDSWTFMIVCFCDGTRTQTEIVGICRNLGGAKQMRKNHANAVRTIRKLLRSGFIRQGRLKHPQQQ